MDSVTDFIKAGQLPPVEVTIETESLINIAIMLVLSALVISLIVKKINQ